MPKVHPPHFVGVAAFGKMIRLDTERRAHIIYDVTNFFILKVILVLNYVLFYGLKNIFYLQRSSINHVRETLINYD